MKSPFNSWKDYYIIFMRRDWKKIMTERNHILIIHMAATHRGQMERGQMNRQMATIFQMTKFQSFKSIC